MSNAQTINFLAMFPFHSEIIHAGNPCFWLFLAYILFPSATNHLAGCVSLLWISLVHNPPTVLKKIGERKSRAALSGALRSLLNPVNVTFNDLYLEVGQLNAPKSVEVGQRDCVRRDELYRRTSSR